MTRDEHDALCEVEAKEFFFWLGGFCDGIGSGTPGVIQVLRIKERLDHLNMRWLDRGDRAIQQCEGCRCGYPKNEFGQHIWPSSGGIGGGACYRVCTANLGGEK